MSQKIRIGEVGGMFDFLGCKHYCKRRIYESYSYPSCEFCRRPISLTYVYLIKELKKVELIEEDYPFMCCSCFVTYKEITKFGKNKDIDWNRINSDNYYLMIKRKLEVNSLFGHLEFGYDIINENKIRRKKL